jgi:hypothetical protein
VTRRALRATLRSQPLLPHFNATPRPMQSSTIVPALVRGLPVGADFNNHYRHALPLYDSLCAAHFDPGWLAESNDGYGDARFRFYPPATYYLLSAGRFITGDWYAGSLLTFALLSSLGALGVFAWSRRLGAPHGVAALAGALYAIAPYHLNELYQASFLAEYAACAVLPWCFAFTQGVFDSRRRNSRALSLAGLALFYAALVLSHLPLTVIGSLSLGVYALLLARRTRAIKQLVIFAAGVALGLLASAFYWVRMLSELGWIQAGAQEARAYYDYRNNFVFSPGALTNKNSWYANLLALVTLGFFLPAVALLFKKLRTEKAGAEKVDESGAVKDLSFGRISKLAAVALLFAFAFLMTTDLSRPVWLVVPKLDKVQFPYRWLAVASLAGCPLLAAGLARWLVIIRARAIRPLHLTVALAFALALWHVGAEVVRDSEFIERQKFERLLTEMRGGASFKDWLPTGARAASQVERMEGAASAEGCAVAVVEQTPERRVFRLAPGVCERLRVRAYFYPHWRARETTEGASLQLQTTAADDGALIVKLPTPIATGDRTVIVEFVEPSRTIYSRVASAVGVCMILCATLFGIFKLRRSRTAARGDAESVRGVEVEKV